MDKTMLVMIIIALLELITWGTAAYFLFDTGHWIIATLITLFFVRNFYVGVKGAAAKL